MTREEMIKQVNDGEDPLDISIQKWQDIVDRKGADLGYYNCALCYVFIDFSLKSNCIKCPISQKTRQDGCEGTPYDDYDGSKESGIAMLTFLKSLK